MASYKRRQSSDYNQSVPETEFIPEAHAYQEKHFQPTLNQPVSDIHAETEYGSTVTPDNVESRADKSPRSTVVEKSDQPGEFDLASGQVEQNVQGNSDPGTQYSTPDVSSGVSSDPGGFTAYGGSAAAAGSTTATTVVATSTVATVSSVAITTVGAAVIAATLILPLVIGVPSAIIFDEVSVTDTTVYYSIYFEDYEEDMELTVSLHNNFTDRSHTVESESISVLEENLKPGMDYKITVYGSMGTVLDEITVTTSEDSPEPVPPEPQPTFTVDAAEFSTTDALIHLSATLDDPDSRYSDFSMVFYDMKDNVRTEVERVSVTDFSSEVTMAVGLASNTSVNGILAVECMDGTESVVLYEGELTAYGNPYIGFRTPPRIVDGTITVDCIIVDTASIRSNYHAMVYVADARNTDDQVTMDGELVGGVFTATGIPEYTFHSGFIKVSWDEEGGRGDVIVYEYNTMTVGAATMTNSPVSYQGTTYEVQFTVDLTLNDDFNVLTDSSGNWLSTVEPTLTSMGNNQSSLPNTFYEVRRTGDDTYVAVFLAENWNEAKMYRLYSLLDVESMESKVYTFVTEGYGSYTTRDSSGNVNAFITFFGNENANADSATAFASDGTEVPCVPSKDTSTTWNVKLVLTNADPYAEYTICLYDYSGKPVFRQEGVTFEYPRLISATYVLSTSQASSDQVAIATAVFEYPVTPIYLPTGQSEIISSETPETVGDRLTLTFTVNKDRPILTGEQYFRFAVADTTSSDYYWTAVFTPST